MLTKKIKQNPNFPSFITKHEIFSKFDTIEKVFPLIGLDNSSMKVSSIQTKMLDATSLRNYLINQFSEIPYWSTASNTSERNRIHKLLCSTVPANFIKNGKIVPVPSKLKEHISNINKTYIDCKYVNHFNKHIMYRSKQYQIYNENMLPNRNHTIHFSSNKMKGLWDIATMSMRGISSCQSWTGSYRRNLIGSMIDPFLGIIYLTDNTKLDKGTKMLKRALVRYVVSSTTGRPALMLEKIYPDNFNGLTDYITIDLFKNFLKKKTRNKLNIVTSPFNYNIPNSRIVGAMSKCGNYYCDDDDGNDYCRSYRDSGINYAKSAAVNLKGVKSF